MECDSTARRWAELLDGWIIPDEILFQAPEDPWAMTPAAMAPPLVPDDTPSRRLAMESLPAGGSVLDVGCGAGAASLALVPPAGSIVGVDASTTMLDAFAAGCRARGVAYQAVLGEWPVAASLVGVAHVVVCHHVAYNVAGRGGHDRRAHRPGPAPGRRRARCRPPVGGAGADVALLLEARPASRADGG